MTKILVVDDQPDVIAALRLALKRVGFAIVAASSPAEAEHMARQDSFDVALIDMNYAKDTTSGAEGLGLISRVREIKPALPIVAMTAWGNVGGAVEAMKLGAQDYLEKPWHNDRLLEAIRSAIAQANPLGPEGARVDAATAMPRPSAVLYTASAMPLESMLPDIISVSESMAAVKRLIQRIAQFDINVLITGEHGTGKDIVARWIHASSRRAQQAFVAVSAGALSDGVFESELFGHVKGAFTDAKTDRTGCFELADGGTLFLDEIGTMPAAQQAKLLRVLQSGEFQAVGCSRVRHCNVRTLSATNVDLAKETAHGRFREDLLYRLNTVEVHLPPLRDRPEDVACIASYFLERSAARYGKDVGGFSQAAMQRLRAHAWPGNVRELQHVVERALLFSDSATVDPGDLQLGRPTPEGIALERMTLEDAQAHLIRRALARTSNVHDAASALGISRSALYRRIQALGIKASE